MRKRDIDRRIYQLMDAIHPLTQHNDFYVSPIAYTPEENALYIEILPRSPSRWADVAYEFSQHEGMKYDRESNVFGIDGQPRVSYSGGVWVRFIGDFLNGSKVAVNISAQQPSHREAEEQLGRYYGLWQENDGLEPMGVFRKFF